MLAIRVHKALECLEATMCGKPEVAYASSSFLFEQIRNRVVFRIVEIAIDVQLADIVGEIENIVDELEVKL